MRRRRHVQRLAIPQGHNALDTVLEPLCRFAHRGLTSGELLKRAVRRHKGPEAAVRVQILHVGVDHVSRIDRVTALPRLFHHATSLEVADLDAVEGLTLARLDHFVLNDGVRVPVDQDLEASFEFVGAVRGHETLRKTTRRRA